MQFSPELEARLEEALVITQKGKTVVLIFEDMAAVADHFQAVLDWFKEHGNRMTRRWGSGTKMKSGWIYFVGADTKTAPIRGVEAELDLRPWADELIRQVGLEARLRDKGII